MKMPNKKWNLFYVHKWIFACMYVYHAHVWCLRKSEEGTVSLGTGVTDDCELSRGC